MIYLLYGQPASGKTVLGRRLASYALTTYHIDGDDFRNLFSNQSYDRKGREENIKAANAVATYLNKTQEDDVVMTLVNPYEHLRNELKKHNQGQVLEVLLTSSRKLRRNYHVDDFQSGNPRFCLNTDRDVKYTWESLETMIEGRMVNSIWR
tara:strand:- start:2490 stop:2942 length:453 start_codon:yes stop_codon:yes gene_type:complete